MIHGQRVVRRSGWRRDRVACQAAELWPNGKITPADAKHGACRLAAGAGGCLCRNQRPGFLGFDRQPPLLT